MPKIQLGGNNNENTSEQQVIQNEDDATVLSHSPEVLAEMEKIVRSKNFAQENQLNNLQRKRRLTRRLTIALTTLAAIALLAFGVYGAFFRKVLSTDDIKNVIYDTPLVNELFPSSAVEGYLRQNINTILEGYITPANSSVESVIAEPNSLYVTRINKRNVEIANVQFVVTITTKEKDDLDSEGNTVIGKSTSGDYNFLVPIRYNTSAKMFSLAGKPELSVEPVINSPYEVEISPYFSYDNIPEANDVQSASAKNFIDTFLRTLYNSNSSIDLFTSQSRDAFHVEGQKFVTITDFHLYDGANHAGFNSFCDFTVQTDTGFSYNTRLYFMLENLTGETWVIKYIF